MTELPGISALVPEEPAAWSVSSPEGSRDKLFRDSTRYFFATSVAQAMGLVRSVAMPLLFTPADLGIWNLMNLVIVYGEKAQLGLLDGMNKNMPRLRGEGKNARAEEVKDSIFWSILVMACLIGVSVWMLASLIAPEQASALRAVSPILFLQLLFGYAFSLLRVDGRFDLLSRGVAALSLFSTVLVLAGAAIWTRPVIGGIVGLTIAYALVVSYWFASGRYTFKAKVDRSAVVGALRIGVPLKLLGVADMLFLSVDRWMIARHATVEGLGHYALGVMVSGVLVVIPASISSVLYTRMLERFGQSGDSRALQTMLVLPLRLLTAIMAAATASAMLVLPTIIEFFLPAYRPSIGIIRLLVVGSFFLSAGLFSATFLTAVDRHGFIFRTQLGIAGVMLLGDYAVLRAGLGISGVATVTAIGYAVLGLLFTFEALRNATGTWRLAVREVGQLVVASGVVASGCGATILLVRWLEAGLATRLAIQCTACVILVVVCFLAGDSNGEIGHFFREQWQARRRPAARRDQRNEN